MKHFEADYWLIIVRRFSLFFPLISSLAWGEIHLSKSENFTQEEARLYCRDLGSSWRQMGIKELFSSNAPFHEGFSYWSSQQGSSDNTVIGTGTEGDGGTIEMVGYSYYPKERNITLSLPTKKIAAACIDTPFVKEEKNYLRLSTGIEDKDTRLLWHFLDATDKKKRYTHEKADEHCEHLTLNNRSWRLPTLEELYGIVDYSRYRPSVDMTHFGAMMHRYYWTSDVLNDTEAYVVGFKLGSIATVPKNEEAYVRCVSE
jgi:hypothetical protein